MHRTQIYFDDEMFEKIKAKALQNDITISAYIRKVLQKELLLTSEKEILDFSPYLGLWEHKNTSLPLKDSNDTY